MEGSNNKRLKVKNQEPSTKIDYIFESNKTVIEIFCIECSLVISD